MARRFLLSLSEWNLDYALVRTFPDLYREEDWRVQAGFVERVKQLLPRIPPVERDVIELYFVLAKKQEVIARMLGLSQQAVSHRLHTAYRRIIFMLYQPEVETGQMRRDLLALLPNPFTVDVLCDFAETSSQTVTAQRLKVPQQRICWHLNAGLKALQESLALDAVFYVQYFQSLREHRNILREVLAGRRKKVDRAEETQYASYSRGPAYGYAGHYAYPAARGAGGVGGAVSATA
jgi:hypothetical protein